MSRDVTPFLGCGSRRRALGVARTAELDRLRLHFRAGFPLMLFALASSSVILVHQEDYRGALLMVLGCPLLALGRLAVLLVRGPVGWRIAAVILASPALFVPADFARRAPQAFGGG